MEDDEWGGVDILYGGQTAPAMVVMSKEQPGDTTVRTVRVEPSAESNNLGPVPDKNSISKNSFRDNTSSKAQGRKVGRSDSAGNLKRESSSGIKDTVTSASAPLIVPQVPNDEVKKEVVEEPRKEATKKRTVYVTRRRYQCGEKDHALAL